MSNKRDIVFMALVIVLLAAGGILTVAGGDREYSENENRYLTQFARPTLSQILSGDTQENITVAMNDQFIGRDFWTKSSTCVEKALGYRDIGGVYFGKDRYYFAKVMNQDISQTKYFQNLRFVRHIANTQKKAKVTALLAPSPGMVLQDKLPAYAPLYDGDRMFQEAEEVLPQDTLLDIRELLARAAERNQVYFRTDHHWTLRGAYTAYQAYCQRMGREAWEYEDFGIKAVSDSFYGTLYSKALDGQAAPDELDTIEGLPQVEVTCDGEKRKSIYDSSKLTQKDKYAYFFGGNYGCVTIKNPQHHQGRLLVIKDSYANTMVPFLMKDYEEIQMLDLRYFRGSVKKLLKEYDPEEILVLYEMSNFAQDEALHKLML